MKSKKSKKVQNIIAQTTAAVMGKSERALQDERNEQKKQKKKALEEQMLLGYLQKTVMADNKKKTKAEKAEALALLEENKIDEKTASIDIYTDPREPDVTRSIKTCDDFVEACEKNVYGWGWK
jgi:hypothetical protein